MARSERADIKVVKVILEDCDIRPLLIDASRKVAGNQFDQKSKYDAVHIEKDAYGKTTITFFPTGTV